MHNQAQICECRSVDTLPCHGRSSSVERARVRCLWSRLSAISHRTRVWSVPQIPTSSDKGSLTSITARSVKWLTGVRVDPPAADMPLWMYSVETCHDIDFLSWLATTTSSRNSSCPSWPATTTGGYWLRWRLVDYASNRGLNGTTARSERLLIGGILIPENPS